MIDLSGVTRSELGIGRLSADLFEGAGDARRIAGELHGRGVGQKLPLARDGGLNQATEEIAHVADDSHGQSHG